VTTFIEAPNKLQKHAFNLMDKSMIEACGNPAPVNFNDTEATAKKFFEKKQLAFFSGEKEVKKRHFRNKSKA
jgi:hypothetical protein